MAQAAHRVETEVDYPTSDGEPMGETDLHRQLMVDLIEALRVHFGDTPSTYVSGNLLLFYEEGNPHAHISPDVLVAPGAGPGPKESYKLWVEGRAPELAIEVTSRSTKLRDVGFKKGLYAAMGVQEYLLFDPRAEYLSPRFQVYRLDGEDYVRCLVSEPTGYASRLGVTFRVEDGALRVFDSATGSLLLNPQEMAALVKAEKVRAEEQAARADEQAARAEKERARAEKLAERLRAAGLDPEQD